jgi:hypothetical protein
MKKACLFALLAIASSAVAPAQVFQHLYGTAGTDQLHDGHTTALGGLNGHFFTSLTNGSSSLFSATRTNSNGVAIPAGAPYFSNQYQLSDVPFPPGATGLLVQEVRSVEISTGIGYGLAGSYINGSSANRVGVFYQQLNPSGVLMPATTSGYFFAGGSTIYNNVHVKKIVNSTITPGDLYILGTLNETAGGYSRIFVLRINQSGALVWSRIYRLDYTLATSSDIPNDIVESSKKRNGVFEVVVVGETYQTPGSTSDAFLLRIDRASGNMINPIQFYGTSTTNEGFTCIKTAANTLIDPIGAGYVIGGFQQGATSALDFWFVAMNQAGTVSWNNTFDYNSGTGSVNNDYCKDLIERKNGLAYEYYLAGNTNNGIFGSDDMMVIHTDQNGNALPAGQFTYGTPNMQSCVRIDEDKTAGSPGIAMYGSSYRMPQPPPPLGNVDAWIVKASFSGITGCDSNVRNAIQRTGTSIYTIKNSDNTSGFTRYSLYTKVAGTINEWDVCSGGCTAPKPPLVAHWNFTGGSLVDPINGLTGTIVGGVTPAAGLLTIPNTAFHFDGTSGYIQVPSNPVLDLQSWTLTALVKPEGFYSGICQANAIIWRGYQYSPATYGMMIFDNATDSDCYIYTPSGEVFAGHAAGTTPTPGSNWLGASPCVTNPCVNLNQWYCVWLSYDGVAGKLDLYVDGIFRVSTPWPNYYGAPAIEDLFIGSGNDHVTFPYYFKGVIDDIAIFGGPLVCPLQCSDAENGLAKGTTAIKPTLVAGDDIQTVPNPTTGLLELKTRAAWENGYVSVLNATGQELERKPINASGKTTIDLTKAPAGMYLLRLQNKDKYTVKKVIRE